MCFITYTSYTIQRSNFTTTRSSNTPLNFVCPHQVLEELKKSNFTLMNHIIRFDQNGNPRFGSYSIVFWNQSGDAQKIGFYNFHPSAHHFINSTKVEWYSGEEVSHVFSLIMCSIIQYIKTLCTLCCLRKLCVKNNGSGKSRQTVTTNRWWYYTVAYEGI